MFEEKENRCKFVESVLTPDVEQVDKISEELKGLQKKKKSYDSYKKSLGRKTDGFNDLLTQLVNMCIDAQLLTDKIKDYPDEDQILAFKQILVENTVPKEEKDKNDEEYKALKEKNSRISLHLTNKNRANKEKEEYIKTLSFVE